MSGTASRFGSTMAGSSKQAQSADHGMMNLAHTEPDHQCTCITCSLAQHEKGDIRMAYSKYIVIKNAVKQLNQMKSAGVWTDKLPTLQEISGIFVSKSAFFSNHKRVFPNVTFLPEMEKWLLNGDDAPEDAEVWGNAKHTFDNLDKILKSHGAPSASVKERKKKVSGEDEVVKGKVR